MLQNSRCEQFVFYSKIIIHIYSENKKQKHTTKQTTENKRLLCNTCWRSTFVLSDISFGQLKRYAFGPRKNIHLGKKNYN